MKEVPTMPAYATPHRKSSDELLGLGMRLVEASPARATSSLDELVENIAERVAASVARQLREQFSSPDDEWLDSRRAAEYLGLHRDSLRRLAAERAIPADQDGPGCKLYFRRAALDEWRRSGGRAAHTAANLAA
jgi:excisionase family DNA binding protein